MSWRRSAIAEESQEEDGCEDEKGHTEMQKLNTSKRNFDISSTRKKEGDGGKSSGSR